MMMEKKVATDSHRKGFEEDHNRRKVKEDANENVKRMSQEEIDKEIAELK